ncbi:MAG: hypothetical protein ACRD4X_03070 [Candidatus Acidiferrales bacterium]
MRKLLTLFDPSVIVQPMPILFSFSAKLLLPTAPESVPSVLVL